MNIFFILCVFLKLSSSVPIIIENSRTCSYSSSVKGTERIFTSKLWKVETQDLIFYYTLCDYLPDEINCGPHVVACLKDKRNNSNHIVGKKIILGNDSSLKAINGDTCGKNATKKYTFTITFVCYSEIEDIHFEIQNDCEYNIYMMDPKCTPTCTTMIHNQLIDLRELRRNYFIETKEGNYSIALCGARQNCFKDENSDISVCKINNGIVMPLSSYSKDKFLYNEQKNEIVYRGSHKEKSGSKKFELLLKCNWENTIGNITYKKPQTQGKEYKFIMESSFGCVKLPPKCVIEDRSLIYNLTSLFNNEGYQLKTTDSKIFLNVCGPLTFRQKSGNSCSKSLSQVCELKDGKYINRGSILSNFEVMNDVIKISYTDGMKCKENPSGQHSTHIDFFCSKTEEGPVFVRFDKCDLFINWKTPQACPVYDSSSCVYQAQEENNCSIVYKDQRYDLSALRLYNNSYEIRDRKNNSISYYLNVCGSVIDPEAPCMKDSMIMMKDLNENNFKYRTKSLGKMDSISIINDTIVIKTTTGTYCGESGDYSSDIHFICDKVKKLPRLMNVKECNYQFEWRTPYACLNKTVAKPKSCLITNTSKDILIDFAKSKEKSIKIKFGEKYYIFDFCKDSCTECSMKGHCEDIPVLKHLFLKDGRTFVEMSLPKVCSKANIINKVIFELICDKIEYNEYFELKNLDLEDNCTAKLLLHTNLVCSKEVYKLDSVEKAGYIINENNVQEAKENCTITNSATGYKIDLSSLDLNIPVVDCPTAVFYEQNSSVVLMYPVDRLCNKSTINAKYEYKAILECSNEEMSDIKKMKCFEIHQFKGPAFCKLFSSSTLDDIPRSSNTAVIVSSVFGVIFFLGITTFCYYKWRIFARKSSYGIVYEKDGDI